MELPKWKIRIIPIVMGLAQLHWFMLFALSPSFYPSEAEAKGVKPSQYGSVFGVSFLAAMVSALIIGKYGTAIGLNVVCFLGAFVQGIFGIGFGFLQYCSDAMAFIVLSHFFRIVCGGAEASAMGAMLSILMKMFPRNPGTVLAGMGSASGLGFVVGPTLGAFLYTIGGFSLPFFVVGTLTLILAFSLWILIPNIDEDETCEEASKDNSLDFCSILKFPSIILPCVNIFIASAGTGMGESMLEPFLRKTFEATQMEVATCFLITGVFFMIGNPIAGWVCDKIEDVVFVSLIGNSLMVVCSIFLGPIPFVETQTSMATTRAVMAFHGTAYSLIRVSSFVRSQRAAIKSGFSDDPQTYNFINGIWTSAFFLGCFVGPTAAGYLNEYFGFRWMTCIFLVANIFAVAVDLAELGCAINKIRKSESQTSKSQYSKLG